jgi:hypothetical protein
MTQPQPVQTIAPINAQQQGPIRQREQPGNDTVTCLRQINATLRRISFQLDELKGSQLQAN